MNGSSRSPLEGDTLDDLCQLAMQAERIAELNDLLGEGQVEELRRIVVGADARSREASAGTIVLIPGVMGSQLGKLKRGLLDLLWFNPIALANGGFSLLKMEDRPTRYGALGLIPFFYTLLWARLKYWYRYELSEFDYDWRKSVLENGQELVEHVNVNTQGPVYLVAHSMGGLVARCAAPKLDGRVRRIIQLATPNYGSFTPIITFLGQNEYVNNVLRLDLTSDVPKLLSEVVSTFSGLYELLPSPARFKDVDLFDSTAWPASASIHPAALATAKQAITKIPPPGRNVVLIAGTGQSTVCSLDGTAQGKFVYRFSTEGDGTVPLELARFDNSANIPTYVANATHSGIVSNGTVATAIDDIIRTGETKRLDRFRSGGLSSVAPTPARALGVVRTLQRSVPGKPGDPAPVRELLGELLGPLQPEQIEAGSTGDADRMNPGFNRVVVGRRRRRLRVVLAPGDITRVPADAHAIGVFEGVTPSGPALSFDRFLNGAVSDLFQRRMFSGANGRIYFLPTNQTPVPGDLLAFVGMGSPVDFQPSIVENVACQLIQSILQVRVRELATVVFGGSVADIREVMAALFKGLQQGLEVADPDFTFNRITLCESDPGRFEAMKAELYRLASTTLFDSMELEFGILPLPQEESSRRSSILPALDDRAATIFSELSVRATLDGPTTVYDHDFFVLPPRSGTSFSKLSHEISKDELDRLLSQVQFGGPQDPDKLGKQFCELLFPAGAFHDLKQVFHEHRVELLHDAVSSRIPWEAVLMEGVFPALVKGLSRRYQRTGSAAMLNPTRQASDQLRVLLVFNPTEDLDGAQREGMRLTSIAAELSNSIRLEALEKAQASKANILARLSSGEFDILHYAGHAAYDSQQSRRSGLICAGNEVLCGADLVPLGMRLPPMIFLNACEAGRVRRARPLSEVASPASAAEAILNAGISCFLATYWPVSDKGAELFATTFYKTIVQGIREANYDASVGAAVLQARKALRAAGESDWANYMLYGMTELVLKKPAAAG